MDVISTLQPKAAVTATVTVDTHAISTTKASDRAEAVITPPKK